ncbi:MAG: succinylglutamate desuccinylase/aspartoacylase family protein [Bacilli bacterium]|jgi:predicted deacylase|nr:succinylglutamate desuccinylase/aspartoacylase family protein [Bacilli bacterium]HHU24331.1 hypothetical protein [Acholeplasmataceae bacterium]
MTKKGFFTRFCLLFSIVIFASTLVACKDQPDPNHENKVDKSSQKILTGTIYETEVYYFKSNLPGPKVAIVGGIHGDEIAGWMVAEALVERDDFKGEVMVIPRANILATELEQRYPGSTNKGYYNNVKYSDLNRAFPGKTDGTVTEQIAYAIVEVITEFSPAYLIDLHESRRSYSDPNPLIGDEIIYGNKKSAMMALEMVEDFNETLEPADTPFITDANPPEGSFNYYFGKNFDAIVFTFETNRQLGLAKRMKQQNDLLNIFFQKIWN